MKLDRTRLLLLTAALAALLLAAFAIPALAQENGAPSAAATGGCGATVTVERGDTLNRIARRCGTTVAAMLKANPELKNPSRIYAGQVLRVPGGGTQEPGGQVVYTVQRGDTLNGIARRFGVTPAAILKANPAIRNPSRIYVGQRIMIPGGGPPPGPTPRPTAQPTARPTAQPTAQPTPGGFTSTKIFLVALNDKTQPGGAIGCGDGIVPVTVPIAPTQAVLRASLEALLRQKDAYYGESGLYNALYASNLRVDAVSIVEGEARIALSGQLVLGGACDAPRVQVQLERTALQFSTVQRVAITVNGKPLAEALSSK